MTAHWTDALIALRACNEAVTWARTQPDLATAWATCERGDWLLWLAGKVCAGPRSQARKTLVRAALACARTAWPQVRKQDRAVVQACYDTTERWLAGTATTREIRTAAADDAYAADAYAAYAAAAAAAAADDDAAAAAAAAYAYAADTRTARLRRCADIVRQHYPTPPRLRGAA